MDKLSKEFLSSEERKALLKKHRVERDGRKRDRIKFILFANAGWSYARISEALLLDDQTLRNYWKDYNEGGIQSLLSFKYEGRPSLLSRLQYEELRNYLTDNTYVTSRQIQDYIEGKYGKTYSKQGVISLLKKMGFTYKSL